jgi:hypothetical protein
VLVTDAGWVERVRGLGSKWRVVRWLAPTRLAPRHGVSDDLTRK